MNDKDKKGEGRAADRISGPLSHRYCGGSEGRRGLDDRMRALLDEPRPEQRWNQDDYRIARRKMIEQQLAGRGIKDARLLEVMNTVPRHFFVDEAQAAQAYLDCPLPIGYGQTISQPYIVALMIEALALTPADRVLEIGSGSGYQTAILAGLAGEVMAVERLEPLFEKGRENLGRLELKNIHLKLADGTLGWPEKASFDAVIVAAGGPRLPQPLVDQLAPGGRMVAPVGPSDKAQKLILIKKEADGNIVRTTLSDCRFVALVGRHGW